MFTIDVFNGVFDCCIQWNRCMCNVLILINLRHKCGLNYFTTDSSSRVIDEAQEGVFATCDLGPF